MAKPIWMIKQSANSLDLYLYDDIAADGQDWWTGETIESDTSANAIKGQLETAGDVQNINIFINSYGGDVKEGLGIYNLLKRSTAQKTVYVDGFACSVASVIAMAGDKVIMGPNTLMMIHHAWTFACGNADELRKAATDLEVIDQASCSSYLSKAGDKLNADTLNQLLDAQTWLNAEQCVQYGLADEIAGQEDPLITAANQRLMQAKQSLINQHMKQQSKTKVPENLKNQKTNAEKLMAAFKKKMEAK